MVPHVSSRTTAATASTRASARRQATSARCSSSQALSHRRMGARQPTSRSQYSCWPCTACTRPRWPRTASAGGSPSRLSSCRSRALLCLHPRLHTSGARRKWSAARPWRSCTRHCYSLCAWTTLQRRVLTSQCTSFRWTTRTRLRPPRRSLPPSRSRSRTSRCSGSSSRALSCVSTRR
jgi:hypothetical protein